MFSKLQAFSFGRLIEAANVIKIIQKNGISDSVFLEAVAAEIEEQKKRVRKDAADSTNPPSKKPAGRNFRKKPRPAQPEKKTQPARQYPETLACPKCGEVAYSQPVCPGCAKGRAGIRREYICGDCNFAFYLD